VSAPRYLAALAPSRACDLGIRHGRPRRAARCTRDQLRTRLDVGGAPGGVCVMPASSRLRLRHRAYACVSVTGSVTGRCRAADRPHPMTMCGRLRLRAERCVRCARRCGVCAYQDLRWPQFRRRAAKRGDARVLSAVPLRALLRGDWAHRQAEAERHRTPTASQIADRIRSDPPRPWPCARVASTSASCIDRIEPWGSWPMTHERTST